MTKQGFSNGNTKSSTAGQGGRGKHQAATRREQQPTHQTSGQAVPRTTAAGRSAAMRDAILGDR
jgi:hypothetical protein